MPEVAELEFRCWEPLPLLTAREFAAKAKVSVTSLKRLIQSNDIEFGFKVGRTWRFYQNDVDQWLKVWEGKTDG